MHCVPSRLRILISPGALGWRRKCKRPHPSPKNGPLPTMHCKKKGENVLAGEQKNRSPTKADKSGTIPPIIENPPAIHPFILYTGFVTGRTFCTGMGPLCTSLHNVIQGGFFNWPPLEIKIKKYKKVNLG